VLRGPYGETGSNDAESEGDRKHEPTCG
jgi:hypothetical protein